VITPVQRPAVAALVFASAPKVPAPDKFNGKNPEQLLRGLELYFHTIRLRALRSGAHCHPLPAAETTQVVSSSAEVDAKGGTDRPLLGDILSSILMRKYCGLAGWLTHGCT